MCVCVYIHARARPSQPRGATCALTTLRLSRACARVSPGARCVPSESERWYTVDPLRDEGARAAGLRASALRWFPFPTGRLDARARGGMHRTGGQRMTVRAETTAALLHPRVFPSRALWCVWPPVTTRSGSHHEAPASEGDTASGRGQRMTLRVKTTAASPASVFPSPAQARSLGSPAHQQHNTLAHSSPRAFKTVCARARGGLLERAPHKHIAARARSKPSHRPRSRTTRRPPVRARSSRRAPRLPERPESFSKMKEKASPLAGTATPPENTSECAKPRTGALFHEGLARKASIKT